MYFIDNANRSVMLSPQNCESTYWLVGRCHFLIKLPAAPVPVQISAASPCVLLKQHALFILGMYMYILLQKYLYTLERIAIVLVTAQPCLGYLCTNIRRRLSALDLKKNWSNKQKFFGGLR